MADDLTDVFIWYSQNLEQVPAELQANVTKLLSVGLPELNSPVKLSDLISSEDIKTVTELAPTSQRDLRKMLSTNVRADDKLKRVNLRKMTIPELRTLAKEHDVTVPSNLTKREIINILMKSEKSGETHAGAQTGGGLVDDNVKLLALIKLDELAVRHQLIEPGRQLPDHCQQAVRDTFERAEHEAKRILTNQSGGAVSPVVIGAIALGSLTLVAIVIYIYRRLRGRTTAQPISTSAVTPQSDIPYDWSKVAEQHPIPTSTVTPQSDIPYDWSKVAEQHPIPTSTVTPQSDIPYDWSKVSSPIPSGKPVVLFEPQMHSALTKQFQSQSQKWVWYDKFLQNMPIEFKNRLQLPEGMHIYRLDKKDVESILDTLPDMTPIISLASKDLHGQDPNIFFILSFKEQNKYNHYLILYDMFGGKFHLTSPNQVITANDLKGLLAQF